MIFVEVGIAFYNNYNPKLNQKQYGFYFFVMVIFPALIKLFYIFTISPLYFDCIALNTALWLITESSIVAQETEGS